ncbi:ribosomal protein L32 [Salinibacter ruber]|uniref:zinc ribbon domain-containing protein n=1 Tax=Salinibacter ruber TaxID=146919 RepID=UPI00216A66A1|nr:zinc ribbon domain-containing protein [Salinibacter ruber]MCS3956732.1 ribosomal protein L32 [Salinibacter ruber]
MVTGVLLFQAIACAVLSGIVASNKNRNPAGWGVLGFLFGLFGLIAVLVMEEVEPQEKEVSGRRSSQSSGAQEFNPDKHEKKCPDCAEYIKIEARVCKHCGREFSDEEVKRQVDERRKSVKADQGGSEGKSGSRGRRDEENYKSDDHDTEEILSTHDFNGVGICEDCDYTRGYAKANNYVCPGS